MLSASSRTLVTTTRHLPPPARETSAASRPQAGQRGMSSGRASPQALQRTVRTSAAAGASPRRTAITSAADDGRASGDVESNDAMRPSSASPSPRDGNGSLVPRAPNSRPSARPSFQGRRPDTISNSNTPKL